MAKRKKPKAIRIYFFNKVIEGEMIREWDGDQDNIFVKKAFDEFRATYPNERMWISMGVEEEDRFDSQWNQYWRSAIVQPIADALMGGDLEASEKSLKIFWPRGFNPENVRNLRGTFGFASKDYVHNCLKVFFEDQIDEITGLPVQKSFAKGGSIGKEEIQRAVPYIQRYFATQHRLILKDFGEDYDLRHNKEFKKAKKAEQKNWDKNN